jgi:hypothetical protein
MIFESEKYHWKSLYVYIYVCIGTVLIGAILYLCISIPCCQSMIYISHISKIYDSASHYKFISPIIGPLLQSYLLHIFY